MIGRFYEDLATERDVEKRKPTCWKGVLIAKIQQKSCLYAELFVPLQRSVE